MPGGKSVEGGIDELAVGLGIFQLLQFFHALVVFDALHLHLGHFAVFDLVELLAQDDVRIFQNGFDQREQHERVIGRLRVHERDGFQQVQRQRLVHGEIVLQLDVDAQFAAPWARACKESGPQVGIRATAAEVCAVGIYLLHAGHYLARMNSTILRSSSERNSCQARCVWAFLALGGSWQSRMQLLHGGAAIALAAQHVQQHAVGDLKARGQPFGLRHDQPRERVFIPVDEIFLRRLALDGFLAVARGFFGELEIFNDVLGGLGHHPAAIVKALAPGAAADLMKVARAENAGLLAVEFAQPGEEHGADGHVDAHAEGVGAADDLEQAFLRQLLHQDAVFGQQPGVVQADAVPQPVLDFRAVGAGELEAFQGVRDGGLFVAGANVDAGEILRALGRLQLGEVDHIHGGAARWRPGFPGSCARGSSE